jgi:hypothetical protein
MAWHIHVMHEPANILGRCIEVTSYDEWFAVLAEVLGDKLEKFLRAPCVINISVYGDENDLAYATANGDTDGPAWNDFIDRLSLTMTFPCYGNSARCATFGGPNG